MELLKAGIRYIRGETGSLDQVLVVNPKDYTDRTIVRQEQDIVLYGDGDKFEIVLHKTSQSYSLVRSETVEEAEKLFAVYKDKIPVLVQISEELRSAGEIQKLCEIVTEHPTWTLAHIAARLGLDQAFDHAAVIEHINSGEPTTGISPLQVAVQANNSSTVGKLVAKKSSLEHVDSEGKNVYHYAAETTKDIILALGSKIVNSLNGRNGDGYSPMHVACHADKPECVRALLELGADVNLDAKTGRRDPKPSSPGRDGEKLEDKPDELLTENMKFGGMPLHWSRSREVINVLAEAKCDVNALDLKGRTALHVMVMRKKLDCVVALLARSASVVVADDEGNTALHVAAAAAWVPVVQALLVFGARTDLLNKKKETPRHVVPIRDGEDADAVESRRVLYVLHAIGAPRCPSGTKGCHKGCMDGENYNGDPVAVLTSPDSPERGTLDKLLKESPNGVRGSDERAPVVGGRLLCLDGGGIRGLVLVQILLEIEALVGQPIVRYFDWIAGTSTGGIIALALATGKSLADCRALYFRMKDDVFVGRIPYLSDNLETILKDALGTDTVMADIPEPKLMITGVLADRKPLELHLFRNYESPGSLLRAPARGDDFEPMLPPNQQLVWSAARATSAAPFYFPASGSFLDGGVIANNPTLDALTEIQEYNLALRAIGRESEARPVSLVVSLGTGLEPVTRLGNIDVFRPESIVDVAKLFRGIPKLGFLLVEQGITSSGRVVDRARAWCSMIERPYYRFNPPMSEEIAMDERSDEKLVKMMWEAKVFMHTNRDQIAKLAASLSIGGKTS